MQFGKVTNPEKVDYTLPADHSSTKEVLSESKGIEKELEVFVGCAKWNKNDLKGFYPKGTKDELHYYASQFNSIEFNASFYRFFPPEQFRKWKEKTPVDFRFFPKVHREISHYKRLLNAQRSVDEYLYAVDSLEEKLGMVFLQLHENFSPKSMDNVELFLENWPEHVPLAMEFRHHDWHNNETTSSQLYRLLKTHTISNIITDTAGRRDLLHMRLTSSAVFIRFVATTHSSDYQRLDDWVVRLKQWRQQGVKQIYFFIHQNSAHESPVLPAYFIKRLNGALQTSLRIPNCLSEQQQLLL